MPIIPRRDYSIPRPAGLYIPTGVYIPFPRRKRIPKSVQYLNGALAVPQPCILTCPTPPPLDL